MSKVVSEMRYHLPVATDFDILRRATQLGDRGKPFVMITVISAKGSTPRNAGAKMLWTGDGDGTGAGLIGTVGGGQFELLVLDAARKHLKDRSRGTEHYILGADADQCCGGAMDVFFEYHGRTQRIIIFGAGHVSRELAYMLEPAGLDVVIADDRPEWNSSDRFPSHACRRIQDWDQAIRIAHEAPQSTLCCVMTCSHDTDFDLLRKLLASHTPAPAFLGLIGSRSKRICLFGRLVAAGLDDAAVQRIICPIGIGDTGKEPRLVAVSMAAQLLLEAQKLPPL